MKVPENIPTCPSLSGRSTESAEYQPERSHSTPVRSSLFHILAWFSWGRLFLAMGIISLVGAAVLLYSMLIRSPLPTFIGMIMVAAFPTTWVICVIADVLVRIRKRLRER